MDSWADNNLTLYALAFPPGQQVTVRIHGVEIGTLDLPQWWSEASLVIPADIVPHNAALIIELEHSVMLSAYEQSGGASPDTRGLTAAYDRVSIQPAD